MSEKIDETGKKPTLCDQLEAEKKKMNDRIFQAIDFATTDFYEKTGLSAESITVIWNCSSDEGKKYHLYRVDIETQKAPR
jgi:hypothetical protein